MNAIHYPKRRLGGHGRQDQVHRLRAITALGKPLPEGTIVHHADGTRNSDAPLVVCENEGYHKLLHARMRVKAAGGDPNRDAVCKHCRLVKPRSSFHPRQVAALGVMTICKECDRRRQAVQRTRTPRASRAKVGA